MFSNKARCESQPDSTEIPLPFQQLAQLLEMPDAHNWQDYRTAFIKRWGRAPGQERWQLPKVDFPAPQKYKVLHLLATLGVINELPTHQKEYDYGILPGGAFPSMVARLDWLVAQWQKGVRFTHLVILTGQRPLTPNVDRFREVMSHPPFPDSTTFSDQQMPLHEGEAAAILLQRYPFPPTMQSLSVRFIESPRKWEGESWRRANTSDTIYDWLAYKPKPGSVLVASSQPSAQYQNRVFQKRLGTGFSVNTGAPAINPEIPLAVILDGIATLINVSEQPPVLSVNKQNSLSGK